MTQAWFSWIAAQGLAPDGQSFGGTRAEADCAGDSHVIAPLLDQGLLRASGADAGEFLHNLLTNDIKGIGQADSRLAGLCTAKGRLLALFLVMRDGEDFLLMLPREILPAVLKKLSLYVLRAKVQLRDATSEFALIGYATAPNAPLLAPLPAALAESAPRRVQAVDGGRALRLDDRRWLLVLDPAQAQSRWQTLRDGGAIPIGLAAWQGLEIAAGQARVVAATQEAFVPQMLNLELPEVGGVSFTKGCYPGQEIVARTQYLGKVKRRTYRARIELPVAAGTQVFAPETGDQHCGAIVSCAPAAGGGSECLVCVQSAAREAGDVRVGSLAGPRLEFLTLPYPIDQPVATGS